MSEATGAADRAESVRLPGSLQAQGKGDAVSIDSPWTPSPPEDFLTSDRYAPYRESSNFKAPFSLQPNRMYVGAASYERTVTVPDGWEGKRVVLHLERPHWFTEAWIDGEAIGAGDSLSTPHRFELAGGLSPGRHTIRLRVDNRLRVQVGEQAHSVSDHTQTNWNGVVGAMRLSATPRVWVDRVRITGDAGAKTFLVRTRVGNATERPSHVRLVLSAEPRQGGAPVVAMNDLVVPPNGVEQELIVELGDDAKLWDEFSPSLYDVTVRLVADDEVLHEKLQVSGLRDVGVAGTQITINQRLTFMRGTLECCVFPKTGYPPTDVESWRQIFQRCEEFGLNHVRFHSYCPPEAAFVAADELGVYLQPEAASWAHVGDGQPIDEWIFAETQRILDEYGNHPSFVMMAYGNEPWPNKTTRNRYLAGWVKHFRQADPRRLYSCASGWPTLKASDFHVLPRPRLHQWGEGMKSRLNAKPPATVADYRWFVKKHDRPVVAHEIGQWCAYPRLADRAKYDGATRAKNLGIFENFLSESGMADLAEPFHKASGALQEICYKEEVETLLRTPGLAGFQMLGLSDFPGQGTAPVGLCDAFWDVKTYASAARFRASCDRVVALVRLPRRVYSSNDTLEASFEVANYGSGLLENATWRWRLVCGDEPIAAGSLPTDTPPAVGVTGLGSIRAPLGAIDSPTAATLTIEGSGGVKNAWSVWVYPELSSKPRAETALVHRSFDASARAALAAGETVVLLAEPKSVASKVQVGFTPIFWNTSYTKNQPPHTLGVLVDPAHPALRAFPTAEHSDWQWWEVLKGCRAMELDHMPSRLRPIVQIIPDWFDPKRLALVFEARVGRGRLLACSADLETRMPDRHAARALRRSLLEYARSDSFEPDIEVAIDDVASLFNRSE